MKYVHIKLHRDTLKCLIEGDLIKTSFIMLHKTFVGNMDYSFHLCQNMFSDDKEMNKDMMAEWTQWKWNTKGELSISQRKYKGSDDIE